MPFCVIFTHKRLVKNVLLTLRSQIYDRFFFILFGVTCFALGEMLNGCASFLWGEILREKKNTRE